MLINVDSRYLPNPRKWFSGGIFLVFCKCTRVSSEMLSLRRRCGFFGCFFSIVSCQLHLSSTNHVEIVSHLDSSDAGERLERQNEQLNNYLLASNLARVCSSWKAISRNMQYLIMD